jgi:hypothetical protein
MSFDRLRRRDEVISDPRLRCVNKVQRSITLYDEELRSSDEM